MIMEMFSSLLLIMDSLDKIVQEIEEENASGRVKAIDVFRSMLNQPEMIAINSIQKTETESSSSFSTFTINLPRPVLQADTIQLVNANIPQCVQNIPDTATTFWYYRLSEYSGKAPNPDNLFCVRLLPTTYKQEYITNATQYGFNKTFCTYQELADELAKACAKDVGVFNYGSYDYLFQKVYEFPYLANEITVPYNASLNKFQCVGTSAQLQLAYRAWNSTTTYSLDDVVYQGTSTFKSLQNTNLNHNPSSLGSVWWVRVNSEIVAPYSATTPYGVGRYVSFNNQLYRSLIPTLNVSPPNATNWTIPDAGQINYRYLVAGYTDPNVAFLQNGVYRTWNPLTMYEAGQIISYNNVFYQAVYQNTNTLPTTVAAWTITTILPPIVGLAACSQAADLIEASFTTGFYQPFPVGVAGQPFSPVPKRLLNSILGFTWNGKMIPEKLANIPIVSTIASSDTELFNRLRPIPLYIVSVPTVGLGAAQSSLTQTFTAEGYCNLVYSSLLSIYATMMGGSTVDTQENTGLLAMGTMNCGNLGVSFFQPSINNPLTIFTGDLYSITFELKDEFGEPYVFTNNAVVSLVMKVTYKKSVSIE